MGSLAIAQMLLLLWPLVPDIRATSSSSWYLAKVASSKLNAADTTTMYRQVRSKILCATLAMHTHWCHLFAFEDGICMLSDVGIEAFKDEQDLGPTTDIWTHFKVGSCVPPFEHDPTLGCIYWSTERLSWYAARQWCIDHDAELYSSDYTRLYQYFVKNKPSETPWVGVLGAKWVNDGRDVVETEVFPGHWLGAINQCGFMKFRGSIYGLDDYSCSSDKVPFLCERPEAS